MGLGGWVLTSNIHATNPFKRYPPRTPDDIAPAKMMGKDMFFPFNGPFEATLNCFCLLVDYEK